MIYIVERDGKPAGAIRVDDQGALLAFKDESGKDVVIRAQGSLLPAFVRVA